MPFVNHNLGVLCTRNVATLYLCALPYTWCSCRGFRIQGMFALSISAKSARDTELDDSGIFLVAFVDALDLETVQISNSPKAPNSPVDPNPPKHPNREQACRKRYHNVQKVQMPKST